MLKLDVWVTFPSGQRLLGGEIVCGDPDGRGRIPGAFRYTPAFRNHPNAFSFDPVALPLSGDEFPTDRPTGVFAVFEDSLPDDWGRNLLVRRAKLQRKYQTIPNLLLALGENGLGALSYYIHGSTGNSDDAVSVFALGKLLTAAEKVENGVMDEDSDLQLLLRAGSSPGGARPKAVVDADDALWIAKFPSVKDVLPIVRIEAATLSLAEKAGLKVPEFKLIEVSGRDVLLVRRFDISEEGGRRHMISMQTLLRAEGWYNMGYLDLFRTVREYSFHPEIDLPALFRQMVFNALVGNTDDHLKNFMMLHDDAGFYLSPAYDLLPDTAERREHVLHFQFGHLFPGIPGLERIGKEVGLSTPRRIIDEVHDSVARWKAGYRGYGISEATVKRLEWGISRRLRQD